MNYSERYEPLKNIYGKNIMIYPYKESENPNRYLENLDPLETYDKIIIGFSGGKDSIAAFCYLLDLGVPKEKIILVHHCIDGKGHNNILNMDWSCTKNYCDKFAKHFGVDIKYSWREEGFAGEIFRIGASHPVTFEELDNDNITTRTTPYWDKCEALRKLKDGDITDIEKEEVDIQLKKYGYKMKFPAKSPDLRIRWCSAILKIEVCERLLRFSNLTKRDAKILFIDGIRREESSKRAAYNEMELHKTNAPRNNRTVHHWRPIIEWDTKMVWNIIEKYNIHAHPCYHLGWSRCSCAACIFSLPCHMKGIKEVIPSLFNRLEELEKELNFTIDNEKDISQYIQDAKSCVPDDVDEIYKDIVNTGLMPSNYFNIDKWVEPHGAYLGSEGGPC